MPIRIIENGKIIISTVEVGEIIDYFERKSTWENRENFKGVSQVWISKNENKIGLDGFPIED